MDKVIQWPKLNDKRIRELSKAIAEELWNGRLFDFSQVDVTIREMVIVRRYAAYLLRRLRHEHDFTKRQLENNVQTRRSD